MKELIMQNLAAWATLAFIAGAVASWLNMARQKLAPWNPITYWLIDDKPLGWGTLGVIAAGVWAIWQKDFTGAAALDVAQTWFASGLAVDALIQRGLLEKAQEAPGKAAGFVRLHLLPILAALALAALCAGVVGCAGGATPKTKNEAQALSYYTIGQAYDAIGAARARKDISLATARALDRQVDLSLQLLDLSRNPTAKDLQAALRTTLSELEAVTVDGRPVLDPAQVAVARQALAIAEQATSGGPLPSSQDTAAWLMLGSNVLRAVGAAIPTKP